MGKIQYAVLAEIRGNHRITAETDPEFLYHLQLSLLLALREQEYLDEESYAKAVQRLKQQPQGPEECL